MERKKEIILPLTFAIASALLPPGCANTNDQREGVKEGIAIRVLRQAVRKVLGPDKDQEERESQQWEMERKQHNADRERLLQSHGRLSVLPGEYLFLKALCIAEVSFIAETMTCLFIIEPHQGHIAVVVLHEETQIREPLQFPGWKDFHVIALGSKQDLSKKMKALGIPQNAERVDPPQDLYVYGNFTTTTLAVEMPPHWQHIRTDMVRDPYGDLEPRRITAARPQFSRPVKYESALSGPLFLPDEAAGEGLREAFSAVR